MITIQIFIDDDDNYGDYCNDADLPILDTADVAEFDMPAKETRPPVCDEDFIKTRLVIVITMTMSAKETRPPVCHKDKVDQFDVIGIIIRFSL